MEHIYKAYGEHSVLEDFSAEIQEGKITCIMAPSGKGKTTLLRLVMGLEQPDRGTISGMAGRRISAVFQEDRLCENLSVGTNIRLAVKTDRTNIRKVNRRILEGLRETGMDQWMDRPVRELSGGMKRRVALLRALYAPWDILFLDEPFKGLDAGTKGRVIVQVKRETRGKTVLFVTHEEQEAKEMNAEIIRL